MRFRANLSKASFNLFREVIASCSRLSSLSTAIRINPSTFSIVLKHTPSTVEGYVELQCNGLFQEFLIESRSNNEIAFCCDMGNLNKALLSTKQAYEVILRLLKKDNRSYFSLRMKAPDLEVTHNIPIEIISIGTMENHYEPPNIPEPNVSFELPTRSIRTVVERFKLLHAHVLIDVDMSQQTLNIRGDTNGIGTQSFFHQLKSPPDAPLHEKGTVKVEIKHLLKAFQLIQMPHQILYGAITENYAIVFHCILIEQMGTITYYLPVLNYQGEDYN